jgi:hypothetical protein
MKGNWLCVVRFIPSYPIVSYPIVSYPIVSYLGRHCTILYTHEVIRMEEHRFVYFFLSLAF